MKPILGTFTDTQGTVRVSINVTKQAHAYVKLLRRRSTRCATWFDVAEAYDAGLRSAMGNRNIAKRQLTELGRLTEAMPIDAAVDLALTRHVMPGA